MAKKKKQKSGLMTDGALAKKYPTGGIASGIVLKNKRGLRIPSRIIRLNYQLNGGLLYGKILELFGPESSGKSLLATDFAFVTQTLGGLVLWADVENAFDGFWMEQNGIDLDKIMLLENQVAVEVISDWVLDAGRLARSKLTNNEPILFVLDSLAALTTLELEGMSQMDKKSEMGIRARKIGDFLRERNMEFKKLGISVILINQLRKKVGASKYEDPDITPGGQATKFYASQRVSVWGGKAIKIKQRGEQIPIGKHVYITTKKEKTGPPRSRTETEVYFTDEAGHDIGFNRYLGLPELLVSSGVLERKKGSSMYYYKGQMVGRGEDSLMAKLLKDDDFRSKMIRKSKINTVSRTRKQIEEIDRNLYPVHVKASKKEESNEDTDSDS